MTVNGSDNDTFTSIDPIHIILGRGLVGLKVCHVDPWKRVKTVIDRYDGLHCDHRKTVVLQTSSEKPIYDSFYTS